MKKLLSLAAAAAMAFSVSAAGFADNNYIQQWGRLKLNGNQLSSESGQAIQLKGWSSFGNFDSNCMRNATDVKQSKTWGANIVRVACYINNQWAKTTESWVKSMIDETAANGMYILVDWHILKTDDCYNCGDPNNFLNEGSFNGSATTFFKTIASYVKEKGYKHVIYELCNEPNQGVSWDNIKSYANKMIDVIYNAEGNPSQVPVVVVGTPEWDQRVNDAVGSPISTNKAHVMYAFHLYANEGYHQTLFESQFKPAIKKAPVFVSEWGLSTAQPEKVGSYDDVNENFGRTFWNAMGGQQGQIISWCNWSFGNKKEGASSFMGNCNYDNLSKSGNIIVEMLGGNPSEKVEVGECFADPFNFSKSCNKTEFKVTDFNNGPDGVAYHDANDTDDEVEPDPDHTADNKQGLKEKGCQAATAAGYSDYRSNQCVDITGCNGGINSVGEGYNIGWISSGEWLRYCIKVTDPGYYAIEMVGNPTTAGNGLNISVVEPGEAVMVDLDKSTESTPEMVDALYFENLPDDCYDPGFDDDANWMHWGWLRTSGSSGNGTVNHGIVMKKAGEYTLEISFPEGFGDMSTLRFTYKKAYTGDAWTVGNKEEQSLGSAMNVTVYPNPANDVIKVNAEVSLVEVLDLAGKVLASSNDQEVNIEALAAGSYIVKAYTNEFGIVTKQIVKK